MVDLTFPSSQAENNVGVPMLQQKIGCFFLYIEEMQCAPRTERCNGKILKWDFLEIWKIN